MPKSEDCLTIGFTSDLLKQSHISSSEFIRLKNDYLELLSPVIESFSQQPAKDRLVKRLNWISRRDSSLA